eukprot:844469-Pelagomonas_calceolata.AAC.5
MPTADTHHICVGCSVKTQEASEGAHRPASGKMHRQHSQGAQMQPFCKSLGIDRKCIVDRMHVTKPH